MSFARFVFLSLLLRTHLHYSTHHPCPPVKEERKSKHEKQKTLFCLAQPDGQGFLSYHDLENVLLMTYHCPLFAVQFLYLVCRGQAVANFSLMTISQMSSATETLLHAGWSVPLAIFMVWCVCLNQYRLKNTADWYNNVRNYVNVT